MCIQTHVKLEALLSYRGHVYFTVFTSHSTVGYVVGVRISDGNSNRSGPRPECLREIQDGGSSSHSMVI